MIIGIHSVAAFKPQKTGVEKYVEQLVKNITMLQEAKGHRFILYSDKNFDRNIDFPENIAFKILKMPYLWTQVRFGFHMLVSKPDALFIPAHVLPVVSHPKNSTVMIHDIAFELFPQTYPYLHKKYLRFTTKYAIKHAKKIIVPSKNTFHDLMRFYKIDSKKIYIVSHGIEAIENSKIQNKVFNFPYFLFIGRLELKKNIIGILKAFDLFKAENRSHHKLVLSGNLGFGKEAIMEVINKHRFKKDIVLTGWVDEDKKRDLLAGAEVFIFPSLYEGFGFPILEAQSYGVPVITSCISSMPEVAGDGAVLVNPHNHEEIKEAMARIVTNEELKNKIIESGKENLKRFSWENCAKQTLDIILR